MNTSAVAQHTIMQKLRSTLGRGLTPLARAWIRYAPVPAGKAWLWQTFHWRRHRFACRTRYGSRVSGDTQDLIQRHLYFFGNWEPHISAWIAATLRPGDGFVDVGANIGYYSLLASRAVGNRGYVVAVEAAPRGLQPERQGVDVAALGHSRSHAATSAAK